MQAMEIEEPNSSSLTLEVPDMLQSQRLIADPALGPAGCLFARCGRELLVVNNIAPWAESSQIHLEFTDVLPIPL